jgi:hypothetical protein
MAEDTSTPKPPPSRSVPERATISVRHVVLILSGKGGVGKTTVAANLALAFSNHGYKTGLPDLDIHGPDIPKMLGIKGRRMASYDQKHMEPVPGSGDEALTIVQFAPNIAGAVLLSPPHRTWPFWTSQKVVKYVRTIGCQLLASSRI